MTHSIDWDINEDGSLVAYVADEKTDEVHDELVLDEEAIMSSFWKDNRDGLDLSAWHKLGETLLHMGQVITTVIEKD